MAEYIKREDALGCVLGVFDRQRIKELPAADVAEVKHGKWIEYLPVLRVGNLQIGCSECGLTNDFKTSYCPNCGAKMDLED